MKPCPQCDGSGSFECVVCEATGWVECVCLCGDVHEAECVDCKGAGTGNSCDTCDGEGRVPMTDIDLEEAGQLSWVAL